MAELRKDLFYILKRSSARFPDILTRKLTGGASKDKLLEIQRGFMKTPVMSMMDSRWQQGPGGSQQAKCPCEIRYHGVVYQTPNSKMDWRPIRVFTSGEDPDGLVIWIKERWDVPQIVRLIDEKFPHGTTVVPFTFSSFKQYFYYGKSEGLGQNPQNLADFGAIKPGLLEGKEVKFFDGMFDLMYQVSQISPNMEIFEAAKGNRGDFKPCWFKSDDVGKREKNALVNLGFSAFDLDLLDYAFPSALSQSPHKWTIGRVVLEDALVGTDGVIRMLVGPQASYRRNLGGDYARLLLYCLESDNLTKAYFNRLQLFFSGLPNDDESNVLPERFKCLVLASIILALVNRHTALTEPVSDKRFQHDHMLISALKKRQESKGKTFHDHLDVLETLIHDAFDGSGYFANIYPDLTNPVFA